MKKKGKFIGIMCVVMLVLCGILFFVEKGAEDSSISNIWDALWYMIVTLTTVGYGDIYPVTVWGKIIGILFVLASMGMLGAILATIITVFNSGVIPAVYLKRHRKEEWFVFSQLNEKTRFLIKDMKNSHKGLFICLGESEEDEDDGILRINYSFEKLIGLKPDKSGLSLFFMNDCENDYENYSQFYNVCHEYIDDNVLPFHCYCLTQYVPEVIPVNLSCFNKYENISRLYWNTYPLRGYPDKDEKIVLIGSGEFGSYIMEHALERNVVKVQQRTEYHLFGDWNKFKLEHYRLGDYFSIDKKSDDKDSIFFHETPWMKEIETIENASRIILCDDDEKSNLRVLCDLRKYFALKNPEVWVHVLYSQKISDTDVDTFGTIEDIYSEEFVLKEMLNRMALDMHALYRSDNSSAPDWNHLSGFKRQSNLAAADHVAVKLGLLNASSTKEAYDRYMALSEDEKMKLWHLEHERWQRFHVVNNWQYSGKRNDAIRHHNLMVSFESLPYEEQKKDAYSWELLSKM